MVFEPDECTAKKKFHGLVGATGIGGIVKQEGAVVGFAFAKQDPCEAILILFLVNLHVQKISFHDLGDEFDGVPPLAFSFGWERNPLNAEVGLHLLVTLDVLQFFYRDQHSGEFALDAGDVLSLVRVDLFAEDVVD